MNNSSSKSILSLELALLQSRYEGRGILRSCMFKTPSSITARNDGKNENGEMNKGIIGGGKRNIYFQAEGEILR